MARQVINIGSSANDGTGDPLRTAFDKINDNFVELYGTDNDLNTLDANLDVNNNAITTGVTNGDITITPNGTGSIKLGAVKFIGTTMSSDDSTQITIAENIQTTGTLNVAGALSSGTSLALASGATVTGIADEDDMTSNSATLLATQQSIKAYVDAQITAEDLDFQADSGGALSIDLDSETMTFTGGTGIDTSGSGNTITFAIDSTVATLTGAQTLTNKVLTSPTISSPTITGATTTTSLTTNDITSNGSNANITVNPQGTGTIELGANTNVTGNASVSGTLTTADITQTGNTTTVGNNSIQGVLTATSVTTNDITTNGSNADLNLEPQGTGAVVIGANITHTGTQTTTGQMNVDNLRIDGNTISATSGGITLSPATAQNVTVSGTNVKLTAAEANFTLMEATTVRADAISTDTSNGDLTIGTQGTGNIVIDTQNIARTGDLTLDVSGYIVLDADGGEVFLRDGTAGTYGSLIRNGANDLTIASGSTQALIFTGANAAFQGNVTTAGTVGTSQIAMEGNRIKTTASNADLQLATSGTGLIDIETATQMTVGAVGAATHLPLDSANEIRPVGYLKVKISGTEYVIPYFNAS
jgi:hypothetical protein